MAFPNYHPNFDIVDDLTLGQYSVYVRKDGTHGIIYCCIQCGKASSGTDKHKFDFETHSVQPSIVHECGWHGHLKNGELVKC